MRDGRLTSMALVEDCLAVLAEREPVVGAFAHLDMAVVRLEAQRADARAAEPSHYPLNGLPVAVKDIFNTHDLPTECGTPLRAAAVPHVYVDGRQVVRDSAVVGLDLTEALDRLTEAQRRMEAAVPQRDPRGRVSHQIAPLCLPIF